MARIFFSLFLSLLVNITSAQEPDPRLARFQQKYPEADLNKDGKLTMEEVKQFRGQSRKMAEGEGPMVKPPRPDVPRYSAKEMAEVYEAKDFKGVPYRFFAPAIEEGNQYPLILSLHGAGGKGTDNLKNLMFWNGVVAQPEFQEKYPCYVVSPQSDQVWRVAGSAPEIGPDDIASYPAIWQEVAKKRPGFVAETPDGKLGLVFELLDQLNAELPIDPDRVYVIGHSMGGAGTFESLAQQPDRFAAGIPSAGCLAPWYDPAVFKHVPVWAFHGEQDTTVPYALVEDVFQKAKAAGGNMKLTTLGGVGHGSNGFAFTYQGDQSNPEFSTAVSSPDCDPTEDVWEWLFAQRRTGK